MSGVEHAKRGGGCDVGRIDEVPILAVGHAEEIGRGHDPLVRQYDLAGRRECGIVRELDKIGARSAAAAGEIGSGDRRLGAVGGEIELRRKAGIDLTQAPISVPIVEMDAKVDLVIERRIEDVKPVRALRRQLLDRQVLGGQWRRRSGRRGGRRTKTQYSCSDKWC